VCLRRERFELGRIQDREEPSFHSRQWSSAAPLTGATGNDTTCAAPATVSITICCRVFVPSKLYDAHPEWFPEIKGQRYRPARDDAHNWQPCCRTPTPRTMPPRRHATFSSGTASRQLLDRHDDTAAAGFCECEGCQALDPTDPQQQKTPRGLPNYSNRFFTFATASRPSWPRRTPTSTSAAWPTTSLSRPVVRRPSAHHSVPDGGTG